jgi:hypothetical protein
VKIYSVGQVDDSAIRFIAETAVEVVLMLKPKAVRLENGMVLFTPLDIHTLLYLPVEINPGRGQKSARAE